MCCEGDTRVTVQESSMVEGNAGSDRGPSRRFITCQELLGSASELVIQHAGEEYRLRLTKLKKLILTK